LPVANVCYQLTAGGQPVTKSEPVKPSESSTEARTSSYAASSGFATQSSKAENPANGTQSKVVHGVQR